MTLVELLVVMLIIGILVGIVAAAVFNVLKNGKIRQAESEVRTIGLAAEEYYRVFREVPLSTTWYTNASGALFDCTYTSASNANMASEFYNRLSGTNSLGQDFLKIVRTDANSRNSVLNDPWGVPYEFTLDSDYNGTVKGITRNTMAFVRSSGPNRRVDTTSGSGNDDVTYPALRDLW